jgi:hypothetical protein
MIRERLIDGRVNVDDRGTIPARVPVSADGKTGQQRRGDAVAHSVEDREIQVAVADRIIERVSGDVVSGFEQPGNRGARDTGVQRRQQIPLHARRQRHLPALATDVRGITDPRGSGDGQAGEHAEQLDLLHDRTNPVRDGDREHSGHACLLRHRNPQPDRAVPLGGHRLAGGERPARHRSPYILAGYPGGQREQHVAGEIRQVDHGIPGRYRRTGGVEHFLQVAPDGLAQDAEGVGVAGLVTGLTHRGSAQLGCTTRTGCAVLSDYKRCCET